MLPAVARAPTPQALRLATLFLQFPLHAQVRASQEHMHACIHVPPPDRSTASRLLGRGVRRGLENGVEYVHILILGGDMHDRAHPSIFYYYVNYVLH